MDDLIERLEGNGSQYAPLMREAAAEIKRLREECAKQYELGQYVATQHVKPARGGSANLL